MYDILLLPIWVILTIIWFYYVMIATITAIFYHEVFALKTVTPFLVGLVGLVWPVSLPVLAVLGLIDLCFLRWRK